MLLNRPPMGIAVFLVGCLPHSVETAPTSPAPDVVEAHSSRPLPLPWDAFGSIPAPDHFTPHTDDAETLSATLGWLQALRDGEGTLGLIKDGPVTRVDMSHIEPGVVMNVYRSPASFNSQDFLAWTVADLNNAHALDLAGLNYDSEDLFHLTALANLDTLKMSSRSREGGQDLGPLKELTALRHLDITGYGLTEEGVQQIAQIASLRSLHIADETIELADLLHLSALPNLAYLGLGESTYWGADPEQLYAAQKALKAALPNCHISGLEHITADDIAGIVPTGPYSLSTSVSLEPLVPTAHHRSRSWARNYSLVLTVTNTGEDTIRLSDFPPLFTNTHNSRFVDGSMLRLVQADGSWAPLETWSFGMNEPAAIIKADRIIIRPGESRELGVHLAYDPDQELLLAANSATNVSHLEYGVKVAAGEVIRLGFEYTQDAAVKQTHNNNTDASRRLAASDWEGTFRSEIIELHLD